MVSWGQGGREVVGGCCSFCRQVHEWTTSSSNHPIIHIGLLFSAQASISITRPKHNKPTKSNSSTMYSTNPPTRASFNPKIPGLAQMPSPPSPLRALVNRLNSTPARRQKAATATEIKTEPETKTKPRTTSNFSSNSNQVPRLSTKRSLLTSNVNNTTPNSSTSSTSLTSSNNNQPTLSQALANVFQSQLGTPTTSSSNKDRTHPPFLDFENSRIEIHFHIHPVLRPAFPTPVSVSQKLKRKRGNDSGGETGDGIAGSQQETGGNRVGNDCDLDLDIDVSEERRSKKKVKLSHEFDPLSGSSVEGRGGRVGVGAGAGAGAAGSGAGGVKTRSRTTASRRSSMRNRR